MMITAEWRRWRLNLTDWWRTEGDSLADCPAGWGSRVNALPRKFSTEWQRTSDSTKTAAQNETKIHITCYLKCFCGRLKDCVPVGDWCVQCPAVRHLLLRCLLVRGKHEVPSCQGIAGQECPGVLPLCRAAKQENDMRGEKWCAQMWTASEKLESLSIRSDLMLEMCTHRQSQFHCSGHCRDTAETNHCPSLVTEKHLKLFPF